MTFSVNVIALFVVFGTLVKAAAAQGAQVQGVDNAEQFALLCRIYNVAKNPPINHVHLQDPFKIVNEINALNASFAEEKKLNETENVGNSTDAQLIHTTTREAAVAQAFLNQITRKAHNVLEEIKKVNATRDIENVKAEFNKVIFGDGGNEDDLCQGTLKNVGQRAEVCGNPGAEQKGSHAGKNLVVDFFCLCSQRTDGNGIDNVCGVQVGGKGGKSEKHGWDSKEPLSPWSMWASIKKECYKNMHQHSKSTKEGHELLEDFVKHLEKGGLYRWGETNKVEGSDRKAGMLGTGVSKKDGGQGKDLPCDGKKGDKTRPGTRGVNTVEPAGICVYYGLEPQWDDIEWLQQYRTSLTSLDYINNQTATIQRGIEKLQMLLHRAEQIYETAKVISEVQNPVQPASLQTAAKRLTAYNAARGYHPHTHFISLFVLL